MTDTTGDVPLHVALCEPPPDPRARPGVAGQSVRLQGMLHDFKDLIPLYGSAFTSRLLDAITKVYVHATGSTTERRTKNLRRMLVFLAKRAGLEAEIGRPVSRVFKALMEGDHAKIARDDMVDAVEVYAGSLRDLKNFDVVATANELTRQNMIESLSTIVQDLGQEGLWPKIEPLKGLRGSRVSRGSNIPALGELVRGPARKMPRPSADDSEANPIELNRQRLTRLRQIFENALLEEESSFDQQVELTTINSEITINDIRKAVDYLPSDYDRQRIVVELPQQVRRCFPLENDELRLSSLLRYLKAEHGGHFRLQDLSFGLQRVVATCGGTAKVMSHLEGGPRALMSAYMLVSIDSGMNIQPCDDLSADPFVGKAKHGRITLRTISSIKNRAGYKPVNGDFLEYEETPGEPENIKDIAPEHQLPLFVDGAKISGARAIEIWLKLSKPQRDRARDKKNREAEYLWILRHGHSTDHVRRYQHASWKHWWNEFLEEYAADPVIGGLPIQRRMVRTTLIQLRQVYYGGDTEVVAMLSGQSSAKITERHYTNRAYLRKLLHAKIREFIKLFEVSIGTHNEERASQLSLSLDEYRDQRETAVATGLGFDCSNPQSGYQPGTAGKTCTRLEACSSCPLLRFVPSQESINSLVLFLRSLEAAQEEFFARNASRWVRVWMPAQALCLAITQLLAAGAKKIMLSRAEQTVAAGLNSGSLKMLRLW